MKDSEKKAFQANPCMRQQYSWSKNQHRGTTYKQILVDKPTILQQATCQLDWRFPCDTSKQARLVCQFAIYNYKLLKEGRAPQTWGDHRFTSSLFFAGKTYLFRALMSLLKLLGLLLLLALATSQDYDFVLDTQMSTYRQSGKVCQSVCDSLLADSSSELNQRQMVVDMFYATANAQSVIQVIRSMRDYSFAIKKKFVNTWLTMRLLKGYIAKLSKKFKQNFTMLLQNTAPKKDSYCQPCSDSHLKVQVKTVDPDFGLLTAESVENDLATEVKSKPLIKSSDTSFVLRMERSSSPSSTTQINKQVELCINEEGSRVEEQECTRQMYAMLQEEFRQSGNMRFIPWNNIMQPAVPPRAFQVVPARPPMQYPHQVVPRPIPENLPVGPPNWNPNAPTGFFFFVKFGYQMLDIYQTCTLGNTYLPIDPTC